MEHDEQSVIYNEKQSIRAGIITTTVQNLANNYFTLFAIAVLGATNYQVSLISSLPAIIGLVAILPAAAVLGSLEKRKYFTGYSMIIARFMLLLMVFVPFLQGTVSAWVFVVLVALMNFPFTFYNLGLQTLLGDIIPKDHRNKYFSERNRIMTFVSLSITLCIGLVMNKVDSSNPLPFQILFFAAFSFSIFELLILRKIREKAKTIPKKEKKSLFPKHVFQHRPYVLFIVTALVFNFGWQMAWPLFSIFQIKYAGATVMWVSLFQVANQVSQMVSFAWWGRMAEKYSNAKMLVVATIGMAIVPAITMLSTNLYYQLLTNLATGCFVAGTVLLLFNRLLESSVEAESSTYISTYNFLLAIVAFIAPQIGVLLLEVFNMNVALIASAIMRGGGAIFMAYVTYVVAAKRPIIKYSKGAT